MKNEHEYYMRIALIEAKKAYKKGEVPIGAIIVKDNTVISKGYNMKENKNIATKHAEIIAIERACKKLGTWHLDSCTLYTTSEPCVMCVGAVIQSRIKTIVYGSTNSNFGAITGSKQLLDQSKYNIIEGVLSKESIELLQSFFQHKRRSMFHVKH